jgi:hypothetical protein
MPPDESGGSFFVGNLQSLDGVRGEGMEVVFSNHLALEILNDPSLGLRLKVDTHHLSLIAHGSLIFE